MLSLLLSSILACGSNAAAAAAETEITLHDANDLVIFSNNINNGASYSGTTILLDSDIDFTGFHNFNPIGNDTSSYFTGTFDGQGHTISHLKIHHSPYTGLFGYSKGITIQNVILDSTCSFENSGSSLESKYIGSFIGLCEAAVTNCNILNSVNMGSVSFDIGVYSPYYLNMGGIAGQFYINKHSYTIKNCVNYGTISRMSFSSDTFIGGIIAYAIKTNIQNCANYGSIVYGEDLKSSMYVGGIIGYASTNAILENCVSIGNIKRNDMHNSSVFGAVVGQLNYFAELHNCYWSDKIEFDSCGYIAPQNVSVSSISSFNDEFVLNETVFVGEYNGTSLIDALNEEVKCGSGVTKYYSHWLLNKDEENITFTVNDGDNIVISLESPLILLPNLANRGKMMFDGWYTDSNCTTKLTDFASSTVTELYGLYNIDSRNFTITFDTRGGSPIDPITAPIGTVVELPRNSLMDRHEISYWETEAGDRMTWNYVMENYNITLYAVWVPVRISSAEEFIEFSNIVNSGKANYDGITVYLDSDIEFTDDLSEEFEPIGSTADISHIRYFNGTFDGQGHSIKNLTLRKTATSSNIGLFKFSLGITIRNLVIDESCTYVDNSTISYHITMYFGAILGACYAEHATCVIENCVNNMNISYEYSDNRFALGGIVGYINGKMLDYGSYIKNCTNHGAISVVKKDGNYYGSIGGIAGNAESVAIHDSTNYGDITFIRNSTNPFIELDIGGIVGHNYQVSIQNCTNYGKIVNPSSPSSGLSTGTIIAIVCIVIVFIVAVVIIILVVRRFRRNNAKDEYEKIDSVAFI